MSDRASNSKVKRTEARGDEAPRERTVTFDDAALVKRSRDGDMQAFGLLVAKYQDRVFNLVYRMCNRRAEAEELAQEAFLRALERIGQFRGHSGFYTWLFRIAANLTISHRRRASRIKFQSMTAPPEFEGNQAEALTASLAARRQSAPHAAAMDAETQERIMLALQELDEDFRLAVILRDIEEMDYAEIARVLDVPVGTVKSRLHRARMLLREKLADLVSES